MAHADPDHPAPAHGSGADAHDDHPPTEPLGPPDLRAWAASLAGAGIAALVAIALFVATQA